jgi:hypothetical protein
VKAIHSLKEEKKFTLIKNRARRKGIKHVPMISQHRHKELTFLVHSCFIAALFTIVKRWKQPKYPAMDKRGKQNVP